MSDHEIDILISRVIDGRSTDADWSSLEAAAARDAGVWRDLALAQRDDRVLKAAVIEATAGYEAAELSGEELHAAAVRRSEHTLTHRARLVATWGGWVAAAGIAIAVVGQHQAARPSAGGAEKVGNQASLPVPLASAADAFNAYLKKGQEEGLVQGQLPEKQLLGVNPSPDGKGYEVTYLRQIVERTHVDNFYQKSYDEFGRVAPVPVHVEQPKILQTAY
ncbi:MAG: hypothetical protein WC718_12140 [Phycisphaerales bacterium]|jgi:hypothetical protein